MSKEDFFKSEEVDNFNKLDDERKLELFCDYVEKERNLIQDINKPIYQITTVDVLTFILERYGEKAFEFPDNELLDMITSIEENAFSHIEWRECISSLLDFFESCEE